MDLVARVAERYRLAQTRVTAALEDELDPDAMKPLVKIGDDCKKMRQKLLQHIAKVEELQAVFLKGSTRFPPNPKQKYASWFAECLDGLQRAENQLQLGDHLGNLPSNLKYDMSRMVG